MTMHSFMMMYLFWAQNVPTGLNKNFFEKAIKFWSTSWSISLLPFLKKSLELIHSYDDALFSGSKWLIGPNRNFFRKSSNIFWIYLLLSFCYLSIAKYERKLLDRISRKLKTCTIHLPQTNGERDRDIEGNLGKEILFENSIYLFHFCQLLSCQHKKCKQKFKLISR